MLVVLEGLLVVELTFGVLFELLLELETLKPITVRITITRSPKGIATQTMGFICRFDPIGVLERGDAGKLCWSLCPRVDCVPEGEMGGD